jgi:ankyrin repeat protein
MQRIKPIIIITAVSIFSQSVCMNLLLQSSTPAQQQEWRHTAFNVAAEKGDLAMVTALLPICQINTRSSPQGFSAIRQAAQIGNLEMVVLLAHAKANVNIEDADGCTPLSIACEAGHVRVVDFLLKNGAKQSIAIKSKRDGVSPLRQASQNGHDAIVDLLLKNGAREHVNIQDAMGATPLFKASRDSACLDLLLAAGADAAMPNNFGSLPLHVACEVGNLGIVKKLLAANPETLAAKGEDDMTPIYTASWNGHADLVKFLIEAKGDVTAPKKSGFIPLHAACAKGHIAVARELIASAPETINHADSEHLFTPLHVACIEAQRGVMALLLDKKADPTLKDARGKTVLDYIKNKSNLIICFLENSKQNKRLRLHSPEEENHAAPEEDSEEQKD